MSGTTQLWLLRHGPTHAKAMIGWTDLAADLSDRAAIARLRMALPEDAIIISSDLSRAVATADELEGAQRLMHDPDLREINFGGWEGRTYAEIEADDGDRLRAFWAEPGKSAPPGGESWDRFQTRVDSAIDALLEEYPGRNIVIACHFGTIVASLIRAAGMPITSGFTFRIDPLSITRLEYHGKVGGFGICGINHCP